MMTNKTAAEKIGETKQRLDELFGQKKQEQFIFDWEKTFIQNVNSNLNKAVMKRITTTDAANPEVERGIDGDLSLFLIVSHVTGNEILKVYLHHEDGDGGFMSKRLGFGQLVVRRVGFSKKYQLSNAIGLKALQADPTGTANSIASKLITWFNNNRKQLAI